MKQTKQAKTQTRPKKRLKLPNWHKHPMVMPVGLFFLLFFATIGLFVSSGGTTMGASDTKVVTLSIDGEKQTVPTRARTVADLLDRLEIELRESDIIEPSLDVPLEQDFRINIYTSRAVLIIDGDERQYFETPEPNPRNVVKEAGIETYAEDIVERDTSEPIDALDVLQEGVISERIIVQRSTPVLLNLFGVDYELRTHAETVADLLAERGVELAEASVFPGPETILSDEEAVFVTDPDKEIVMEEQEISPPEEIIEDFELAWGQRQIRDEGRPGRRIIVYELAEDGSRSILQDVIVRHPISQVVAEGRRLSGISNPSENVRIGESMAADRGWTGEQWLCLYNLWQRESRWETTIGNPSSGAYGIPQSLPGEKMASVGSDWRTNPVTQVTWGLNYITDRYGNPCEAWRMFNSRYPNPWY